MKKFLAAAVQMRSGEDKEANLTRAEELLEEAAARRAELVVLPEVFNFIGSSRQEPEQAEAIPGPTTDRMAAAAKKLGFWLVAGSILEKAHGEEKLFNTSTVFSPEGRLVARYRKMHLFDVAVEGGPQNLESACRQSGRDTVVADTELCRLGLSVCYDLRFPELYRKMTFSGAEVITAASDFTLHTGKDHWEPLIRARAIENQVYIIASNQVGKNRNFSAFGSSMIVDPWGTVLARAAEKTAVITAEIDPEYLLKVRRELPALQHLSPCLKNS